MYYQMTLTDWVSMKDSLRADLQGVAQSFVRIGYKLRKIEEQRLYEQDGYKSLTEFAKAEYGLSQSTTSRFMAINAKYSIGGYGEDLRAEFAALGSSKLSEMLTLPDADLAMITPETPREAIRELKNFEKSKPTFDGVELIEALHDANREAIREWYRTGLKIENLKELLNPAGTRTFRKGVWFLMMYETQVMVKRFPNAPEKKTWEELAGAIRAVYGESEEEYADRVGEPESGCAGEVEEIQREPGRDTGTGDGRDRDDGGRFVGGAGVEAVCDPDEGRGTADDADGADEPCDVESEGECGAADESDGASEDCRELVQEDDRSEDPGESEDGDGLRGDKGGCDSTSGDDELGAEEHGTEYAPAHNECEREKESIYTTSAKTENDDLEIVKPFGTRWKYMKCLTAQAMAEYICEAYRRRELRTIDLMNHNAEAIEEWLKTTVDTDGEEVE